MGPVRGSMDLAMMKDSAAADTLEFRSRLLRTICQPPKVVDAVETDAQNGDARYPT